MFVPLNYNLRSLVVRKTTSLAAAAGIALVVFVLASSLMLSKGIRKTLASSGAPDRAIVLRKGADTELASNIDTPTVSLITAAPGVKRDAQGNAIATSEIVVVLAMDKLGVEGQISNVQVRGVQPMSYTLRKEVKIIEGRPAQPGTDEAVIGKGMAGRFRGLNLGESFDLKKNRPVKVVGIMDAGGTAFDSEIWVDIETLRSSFGRDGIVSSVMVLLYSAAAYDGFDATIEHDKRLGLEAFVEEEYYKKQSEGTAIFITAIGILIAFFFSLGAMIGATITMYAAVSQRSKEIGTLRALGFSRFAIMTSFVFEAVVLAFGGGIVGAFASIGMGAVKFSMMNFATWQEISFSFDPDPALIATSLVMGAVMGFFGGLLPAIRAARMSPLQAMRAL
jgi:putative ABC transport system permease protein